MPLYSLKKSKKILWHAYSLFKSRRRRLASDQVRNMQKSLENLQDEILRKNKEAADERARYVESLSSKLLKKNFLDHARDLFFAIAFALLVAVVVRQMWFELYEIPTGSMRPTFKEQDRLIVSKTDFGINVPLTTKHLYFNEDLVERSGVVIFTVENMDVRDPDTMYFYLFPGKKQYVKRMIGKPGDLLYFYGGEIYGIDKNGRDISHELQLPSLSKIDHIPFIHFEGNVSTSQLQRFPEGDIYTSVVIHQMNEPIARLNVLSTGQMEGEMLKLTQIHDPNAPLIKDYGELWGFKNYATARLLTKEQAKLLMNQIGQEMEEGLLYLELKHHPSLSSLKLGKDLFGRMRPMLHLSTSLIPLQEKDLRTLFANLYTARFVVKNGFAMRYDALGSKVYNTHFLPQLPGVPDGSYEFYYGKAYQVKWGGITEALPENHPLYNFDPKRLQLLFNLGIEFDTRFAPENSNFLLDTGRYAYFKNGALYTMGAPLFSKEASELVSYLERESRRETTEGVKTGYRSFKDEGAPFKENGDLDIEKIRQFGLLVPSNSYLVLGDNYAMSADSREFGFVPQQNLRGAPSFIFWPPGNRWGAPNQPSYSWMTFPNIAVWILAVAVIIASMILHRRKNRLPLSFDFIEEV